jgi:hypothetical protein
MRKFITRKVNKYLKGLEKRFQILNTVTRTYIKQKINCNCRYEKFFKPNSTLDLTLTLNWFDRFLAINSIILYIILLLLLF